MAGKALKVADIADETLQLGMVGNGLTIHVVGEDGTPLCPITSHVRVFGTAATVNPTADVCKGCSTKIRVKRAPLLTPVEAANIPGLAGPFAKPTTTNEGDSMATVKGSELDVLVADVQDMLNRLSILAEDVAAQEAYAALSSETEAAISAIPTKMKGATAEKKRLRGELGKLDDAADANQKVSLAEVAKVHEGTIVAATTDYHDVITTEEFDAAVTAVKDVVSLHLKASDAAKAVAHVILQGRLKIRDKSGNADTRGASHQAKAYAGDVYRTVAAGFELAEDEENLAVIKRLQESTSYHMSDEVATLARELDEDVDRFKDLFPGVAAAHPDLTPRAALVASSYAPDKSKRELAAERQKAKALAAGTSDAAADAGEGDSEGETTEGTPEQDPFEAVSAAMTKGSKLIAKAWAAGSKLDTDHKAVLKADLTTLAAQLLAEANKL